MSVLSAPYMHDEPAAFAHVEEILWPAGPVCPHCGVIGEAYSLNGVRSKPSKKHPEGKERHGLKKCKACGKQFTVRIGTIFESSHIDLHLWLQAIYLMTASKKGISANQLHRTLGITFKSAWFMGHRIRKAMREDGTVNFGSGWGRGRNRRDLHRPRQEQAGAPGLRAQAQGAGAGGPPHGPRPVDGGGRPEGEDAGSDPAG